MCVLCLAQNKSKSSVRCKRKVPAYKSICRTVRTRNAFLHYANEYRKRFGGKQPLWDIIIEAGERWNDLPLHEKLRHADAARGSVYTYRRTPNRQMNAILQHLRGAMQDDTEINCIQLAAAIKKMQSWKKAVFRKCISSKSRVCKQN